MPPLKCQGNISFALGAAIWALFGICTLTLGQAVSRERVSLNSSAEPAHGGCFSIIVQSQALGGDIKPNATADVP
jgi:hypothetical protein